MLLQPIESRLVQECVKAHYILSNRFLKNMFRNCDEFQGIGYKGYLRMARMASEVLTNLVTNAMYEHYHYQTGMADHLHEAMICFSESALKNKLE